MTQKRHDQTPLDLTTVAHHLALLDLPPVAEIRDTAAQVSVAANPDRPQAAQPDRAAQMLSRATGLRERLDATLM